MRQLPLQLPDEQHSVQWYTWLPRGTAAAAEHSLQAASQYCMIVLLSAGSTAALDDGMNDRQVTIAEYHVRDDGCVS